MTLHRPETAEGWAAWNACMGALRGGFSAVEGDIAGAMVLAAAGGCQANAAAVLVPAFYHGMRAGQAKKEADDGSEP